MTYSETTDTLIHLGMVYDNAMAGARSHETLEPSWPVPPQPMFGIGQPVWQKSSPSQVAYIVHRYVDDGFMEIVRETDLTGPVELAHESYFSEHPPSNTRLHAEHVGIIHFTATGRALKEIDGGRR